MSHSHKLINVNLGIRCIRSKYLHVGSWIHINDVLSDSKHFANPMFYLFPAVILKHILIFPVGNTFALAVLSMDASAVSVVNCENNVAM